MGFDLCEGLLMTILQQLPIDCLCRFKCVSKSWLALITSLPKQDVLVKHLVTNKDTGKSELIFSLKYPFTADDDDEESIILRVEQDIRSPVVIIHGHSHGIVCFSHGTSNIFLYIAATGEIRTLAPSLLVFPYNIFFTTAIGFGYDSKSRDFKVVRIAELFTNIRALPRAEVYDFGKDGWRVINSPILAHVYNLSFLDMYYQGCYYWWATHIHSCDGVICCFDFTKEVFSLISVPNSLQRFRDEPHYTRLGVLNGSIVLFKYRPASVNEKSFDVWKMVKDDDVDGVVSWTKLFTFGPLFGVRNPLAFLSSDELLMEDNEGHLVLCNIFNTQHRKRLPIKGECVSIHASLFVKTALPFNEGIKHSCV